MSSSKQRRHESNALARATEQIREFISARRQMPTETDIRMQPKVSIVMPTFNQARFIERSILSVINQGYPNIELIVVDGGSNDGTQEIVRRYCDVVGVFISERDGGQSDALNKGFSKATGEIFGWLNSDDLFAPGMIHRCVQYLTADSSVMVAYGDYYMIDADDAITSYNYAFDFSLPQLVHEGFFLNAQSMLWRRSLHERFGEFDVSLNRTMDYDMIVRFAVLVGASAFRRIAEPLGCFRMYLGQKTSGMDATVRAEHARVARKSGVAVRESAWSRLARPLLRIRRVYWYWRRAGMRYCVDKMLGSAR